MFYFNNTEKSQPAENLFLKLTIFSAGEKPGQLYYQKVFQSVCFQWQLEDRDKLVYSDDKQ